MYGQQAVLASVSAVIGLAACPTRAQTVCWYWELVDTAGNSGFVDVGESASLTLWASYDPDNHGFAQAGPYDITGDTEWADGTIDVFNNLLYFIRGFGTLGSGNSITSIENFQLIGMFNPDYNSANPIPLYSIEWTPDRYEGQFATITNDAPDAYIYKNDLGNSDLYTGDPDCGPFTFQVLPAPGSMAVLGLALLMFNSKRR